MVCPFVVKVSVDTSETANTHTHTSHVTVILHTVTHMGVTVVFYLLHIIHTHTHTHTHTYFLSIFAQASSIQSTVYAIIFAYSYFRGFGQVR